MSEPLELLTRDERLVFGVCSTIAARFDLEPIAVRLAFVTLAIAGGWGVVLYLALRWLWLPRIPRPLRPIPSQRDAPVRTLGVALAMAGTLLLLRERAPGFADQLVWPMALVASGLMLTWHQVLPIATTATGEDRRRPELIRIAAAVLLVASGLTFLAAANMPVSAARNAVVAGCVVAAGLFLMFGPWVMRLTNTLADERSHRIRADERAEVAAHLHDSVLQTLTLMQKRAEDPAAMATLARQQERQLRRWLYGPRDEANNGNLRDQLDALVTEVEDQHLVRIEAVTVGDMAAGAEVNAILAAAREALINAAKFSGERQVSLYAQVTDSAIEIFVRDRGKGFDLESVPPDRHGISESIVGRMQRCGGNAAVRTAKGKGTEVRLELPRGQQ